VTWCTALGDGQGIKGTSSLPQLHLLFSPQPPLALWFFPGQQPSLQIHTAQRENHRAMAQGHSTPFSEQSEGPWIPLNTHTFSPQCFLPRLLRRRPSLIPPRSLTQQRRQPPLHHSMRPDDTDPQERRKSIGGIAPSRWNELYKEEAQNQHHNYNLPTHQARPSLISLQ
jgi:hypothetical protein